MTVLLDANVLIALAIEEHVHHDIAEDWLSTIDGRFATCPTVQGALARTVRRGGSPVELAQRLLASYVDDKRHEFWPDDLPYDKAEMYGVLGHKQVADAYLAAQARLKRGQIATFDRGLAALHPDVAVLVPTDPQLPEQRNGG